jgi:predicted enzyme related to lactoylglutathione lyase
MALTKAQQSIHGAIVHFDVAGENAAALTHFYANLFGWQANPRGPGYFQLATPDGSANGAVTELPQASLTMAIAVKNLEAALENAAKLGGTIVMPATDNGWVNKAQVADPAGNLVTLIEAA